MGLSGVDTAAIGIYSDEIANRPDLVALRKKVEVEPRQVSHVEMTGAEVVIETDDATYTNAFNVGIPATDIEAQEQRLCAKFDALVEPVMGREKSAHLRQMALLGEASPMDLLRAGTR